MLDEMSENNPEGYKSFVNTNVKKGFENLKQEKEAKMEKLKVKVEPILLLKMQAKLDQQKLKKEEDQNPVLEVKKTKKLKKIKQIKKKIKGINKQTQIPKLEEIKKKFDKEVKIYINLMASERVKAPLNENGNEIKELSKSIYQMKIIPYSVQKPEERKSNSLGNKIYFYNFVMNDTFCKFMGSQIALGDQLINFIIEKMQQEILFKVNPLLNNYNFQDYEDILYYKIEKLSIVKHKKKKFKLQNGKNDIPLIFLDLEVDKEQEIEKQIQKQKEEIIYKQQQDQPQKEQILEGLKIVDKQNVSISQKSNKKILIEEISNNSITSQDDPNINKTIVNKQNNQIEKPSYVLKEDAQSILIQILLPKVDDFGDIALDISELIVKLEILFTYKLEINLPSKINIEKSIPKWNKKTKTLKLILNK
ncbi:hypothetical protein IMG5_107490 [Ichthyophthirius multifiliis]|uniref:PIH1D1/2/3 CS-like domain-containing protein n=1 Tax=Ichthyophthirius multifiliis TaxID=5932 RepID=G0QTF2_ICHMU|nr:hypothetical protein IMG5_107490 [Ichthyophthirius multifiliis]EGR31529.1 hypothetical protein IMG5_107490 [Ichthyophthirius multifiliis]|eukprot:XP_004035015.1 hypothetical protein IMG5_107490 [Ichthyophthirius multifiliis]